MGYKRHQLPTENTLLTMELLVLIFTLLVGASAKPQGYDLAPPSGPSLLPRRCSTGQVLHVDGRCVTPRENRRVFLYDVPKTPTPSGPPPFIPAPTVEKNLLFIRTPEGGVGPDPIIVPPPRQEHVVYILNKQSDEGQKVIQVPAPPPSDPEVYFVNYAEGENPTLPSGVDLQTALNAASETSGNGFGSITSTGSSNGFGSINGFAGTSGVSSNGFGSTNGFGNTNGISSISALTSEFAGNNGLSSNGFGSNIGFGGSNGFGSSNGLGSSNGFESTTGLGAIGLGGSSVSKLSANGQVSSPSRLYRAP
ncbi:ATP-dependent RNA helicase A-like [Penaeus monodon]|uniref:ATP-dependent RNA helicase A-like n=1 Tax=Penaeus monodon TaxID=6687 RepID=UPI0018A74456|nr:ATP-dependent RNA helicase A-like [Penaeus monodon]